MFNHFKNIMILFSLCLGVFTIYPIVKIKTIELFMYVGSFQFLNKEQVKPDVVFVGSSHVEHHLSYPYFANKHISNFNLGLPGSSGITSLNRLIKYLSRVHYKPKMVFFDGFFLQRNSLSVYYINSKDVFYRYMDLPNHHFGSRHGDYLLSGYIPHFDKNLYNKPFYKKSLEHPKKAYLESLKVLRTTSIDISNTSSYYQYMHFLFEKIMKLAQQYRIQIFMTYVPYPTSNIGDSLFAPIGDTNNRSNNGISKKLAQDFHVPFIDFYDSYNEIMLDAYKAPLLNKGHFLPIFNHISMLLYQKVKNMGYSWPIAPVDNSFLKVYRSYWNNKYIQFLLKDTQKIRNDKQYQKYISFPKKEWL